MQPEIQSEVMHFLIHSLPVMLTVLGVAWRFSVKFGEQKTIQKEFLPHRHDEKKGELSAEGITYPRSLNGK